MGPDELVMPSGFVALDDGDQYVLLQWTPMLLAEAHVELETRTVELNETDEWSHVAIVAFGNNTMSMDPSRST